jgi:phosphomevalonate kinase
VIASAPGKLILTGEYAVLDGAPALVVAVDRRAVARRGPCEPSEFLRAVAAELAARGAAPIEISVDSSAFYEGTMKLGLGSSAAVTVAATACALGDATRKADILAIAMAAHATAQAARGARGSGADIAAAVYGGAIVFTAAGASSIPASALPSITRLAWPAEVVLLPFFTGASADTVELVARVAAARTAAPAVVEAALAGIAAASRDACEALAGSPDAVIAAFERAAVAIDRLAAATHIALVPGCVAAARSAMARLGGTAKTTGAGGGDIGIAVIPATTDVTAATRSLIEAGCRPLQLSLDPTGVDTCAAPQ